MGLSGVRFGLLRARALGSKSLRAIDIIAVVVIENTNIAVIKTDSTTTIMGGNRRCSGGLGSRFLECLETKIACQSNLIP